MGHLKRIGSRSAAVLLVVLTALVGALQSTDLAQIVPKDYVPHALLATTFLAALLPSLRECFRRDCGR